MNPHEHVYLAGEAPQALPLSRFLPLLPAGMTAGWLKAHVPPGSWVLDPLGSSPALALEAARAGYRVAVTNTNPILSFMLETMALSPQEHQLQAAVSALAILRRGDVRLENEMKGLYETRCPLCGMIVQAEGYLWEKNASTPYACLYNCPECKEAGEHPPTDFDLQKLHDLGSYQLHYSRALERVNIGEPQAREGAKEALNAFLPRQLYVISTLINKTASLNVPAETRQLLHALIISVCDQGNTLWSWPSARSRPRQLSTPPRFQEKNLWAAFETAVDEWQSPRPPVELTHWPELPGSPQGICLYNGRPGALLAEANSPPLQALVSVLPRPSQAFWTLSALWSGWLWGPEAVLPMKSALERRRYDWSWYAEAVYRLFRQLQKMPPELSFLTILPEVVSGYLAASIISTSMSGLRFRSLALNEEEHLAQVVWETRGDEAVPEHQLSKHTALNGMLAHLEERGEPARQIELETAGLAALAEDNCLASQQESPQPADKLNKVLNILDGLLADRKHFLHDADPAQPHSDHTWWPVSGFPEASIPLTDRVEKHILEALINAPAVSESELSLRLYEQFPGLLTPPQEMITTILSSYAFLFSEAPAVWQLNEQERPENRLADLQHAQEGLLKLGKNLGYFVEVGERTIHWFDKGQLIYCYFCFASSMIHRFIIRKPPLPEGCRGVLVFPGSRSRLLAYKLLHNPYLARASEQRWTFLKFRHLRRFVYKEGMDRTYWEDHLHKDPPLWEEATQMSFFA